jgi:hypothetical protein
MSRSNLNRKTGKNDGYRVPYRGPSKYTQGVSTIRVQAPNTDGQVFVTVTLKPEDIEEIYSLYEANGRDIFKRGSSRVDLQACKLGTGRRFTTS